jgi:hypothetical protein
MQHIRALVPVGRCDISVPSKVQLLNTPAFIPNRVLYLFIYLFIKLCKNRPNIEMTLHKRGKLLAKW